MYGFFNGKRVLVTGHTGFKGSWLCRILKLLGAEVYGYSLSPPTDPNLHTLANNDSFVHTRMADIRDLDDLSDFYKEVSPDIVFHLAAQPLVKEGYNNPVLTYETNVMGTVNILECQRRHGSAISIVNVTTDKVYDNDESGRRYSETDRLDGYDPYSNSKSCSELVTHSYKRSFLDGNCAVSTARAGNVIGGGDFAADRIIPDCVRAASSGKEVVLRNPNSVRPYQHVMEPLFAYLKLAELQAKDPTMSGSYNIGPDEEGCVTTEQLADMFCRYWGNGLSWRSENNDGPHEAGLLKLNNSLIKTRLGISPMWGVNEAVRRTVEWTRVWIEGGNIALCVDGQIEDYLRGRGIHV